MMGANLRHVLDHFEFFCWANQLLHLISVDQLKTAHFLPGCTSNEDDAFGLVGHLGVPVYLIQYYKIFEKIVILHDDSLCMSMPVLVFDLSTDVWMSQFLLPRIVPILKRS